MINPSRITRGRAFGTDAMGLARQIASLMGRYVGNQKDLEDLAQETMKLRSAVKSAKDLPPEFLKLANEAIAYCATINTNKPFAQVKAKLDNGPLLAAARSAK